MEMIINLNKLITEKNKRAWTQGHLAEVCDLSLRTIQRIEKTGVASHETIKSLASVFEVSIEELIDHESGQTIDKKPSEVSAETLGTLGCFSGWVNGKKIAIIGLFFILLLIILSLSSYFNNRQMVMTVNGNPWYFQWNNKSFFEILSGVSFITLLPGVILLSISRNIYKYNKPWSYWLLLVSSITFIIVNIKFGVFLLILAAYMINWYAKRKVK